MKAMYNKDISVGVEGAEAKEAHNIMQSSYDCDERVNISENKKELNQDKDVDRDLQLDRWMENIKAFIRSIDVSQL